MFRRIIVVGVVLFLAQFFTITRYGIASPDSLVLCSKVQEASFDFPQLQEIVKAPLRYLGQGGESVAFVSADDQYVVKFFLNKYLSRVVRFHPRKRMEQLFFARKRETPLIETVLQRYEQGLLFLPKETAMLAMHRYRCLEKLPLCTLQSSCGKTYTVDLNDYVFVVQHKCTPVADMEFMEKRDIFYPHFQQLFSTITDRGFGTVSQCFNLDNFGFLDGKAVIFDLGRLEYHPEQPRAERQQKFEDYYQNRPLWKYKTRRRLYRN